MRGRLVFYLALSVALVACGSNTKPDQSDFNDAQTDDAACVTFVNDFYDICQHTLFDLDRNDATQACKLGDPTDVWPCIMNCWTAANQDCHAWSDCVNADNCLKGSQPAPQ
jgi:hypothetical protein